jgi:hypothetical protein
MVIITLLQRILTLVFTLHFKIIEMKQIRNICIIVFFVGFCSCRKNVLNIPGTNQITQAQIFTTTATVNAYLATLYSDLPMEDYSFCNGSFGQFPGNGNQYTANWTDEANSSNNSTLTDVYAQIYQAIRATNNFIASVTTATGFTQTQVNYWLGEAKFIRAYDYFALARYYGGVPLILTVQTTATSVPRNKEVEVWNQIKTDVESAASLMSSATLPNANYGHATKWAAFALEAKAMLHAGSIGMFDNTGDLAQSGGINGVDPASAQTYMQAAYNAADSVIASAKFSLYMKYPTNLAQNFEYLFYDNQQGTSNSEGIFYRGYDYLTTQRTHSEDLMALPHAIRSSVGYGNMLLASLDLVEKFQNTDGSSGVLGADKGYNAVTNINVQLHYPSVTAPFANKDARFAGTIIAPGTAFRNSADPTLGLQGGWITSQKGVIHNGIIYNANNYAQYFNVSTNVFSANTGAVPPAGYVWGSGNSGGSPTDNGSDDAFWLKKWTDPVTDISLLHDYTSRTSWTDMRYGEVLMDFAEASFLLNHAPSESLGAINQIRARAGMPAYTTITQDEIRNERFVEFAYENKNYWDYVRWRTLTTAFSNRPEYGLRIYWDIDTQDYVFIKIPVATKTYVTKAYYFDIPANDISSSPAIAKQVNAGHNPGY